jgi:hypothetical protein
VSDLDVLKFIDLRAQLGKQQIEFVMEKINQIDPTLPNYTDPVNSHYHLEY